MVGLLALVLILALLGGGGFVMNALWYALIIALVLWLVGYFVNTTPGGRRTWYGW